MKKILANKYLSATLMASTLFVGLTQFANAQLADAVASGVASFFNNVGYYVIGKIAFGISYLIAWVAGVAISIEAWLVGVMLAINNGVFQAEIVQKGFGVTLSIANLGFVLGIIVIAIATILRSETYGYKKLLWKLIVAAILVNFSLVIAAPIFGLGNSFTQYFLNCIDPAGGGCTGQGAGIGVVSSNSMNDFAANLAGAFNPQDGLLMNNGAAQINNVPTSISLGTSFGNLLTPIFSILFVAFELIAIAVVLAVFVFMLLARCIWIAILAILMPFAWLGWVFPNMKSWWSKWWQNFFRWTFFAPIVVFFLYLGMATAQAMRTNSASLQNQNFGTYTSNSNAIWAPIAQTFTALFTPIIAQILNTLVMIGLTIGGLIVANKLSITGASAGVNAMKSVGGAVQGYVGRRTRQAATAPLRSQRVRNAAARLQQRSTGTGVGARVWRGLGFDYLKRQTGRGLESGAVAGGEGAIEDAKKQLGGLTESQRLNRLSTAQGPFQRMALMKQIMEDKNLSKLSTTEMERYFGKEQEDVFKRYGQEKLFKDLREKSGLGLRDLNTEIAGLEKVKEEHLAASRTDDAEKTDKEIKEKKSEKWKMLASYIEDNPDAAADSFTDLKSEKLAKKREEAQTKTGRIPASLEDASLKALQEDITKGIADGLSPHNVSSLISALSKKNNLTGFRESIDKMNKADPAAFAVVKESLTNNKRTLNWNDKQVGRGTLDIDLRDVYDLPPAPSRESKKDSKSEGDEDSNGTATATASPAETKKPDAGPKIVVASETGGGNRRDRVVFDDQGRPKPPNT